MRLPVTGECSTSSADKACTRNRNAHRVLVANPFASGSRRVLGGLCTLRRRMKSSIPRMFGRSRVAMEQLAPRLARKFLDVSQYALRRGCALCMHASSLPGEAFQRGEQLHLGQCAFVKVAACSERSPKNQMAEFRGRSSPSWLTPPSCWPGPGHPVCVSFIQRSALECVKDMPSGSSQKKSCEVLWCPEGGTPWTQSHVWLQETAVKFRPNTLTCRCETIFSQEFRQGTSHPPERLHFAQGMSQHVSLLSTPAGGWDSESEREREQKTCAASSL